MSKQQTSGMRGVYLVAAELSKRNYIVSVTSRSAKGADILITYEDQSSAHTVEVKSDKRGTFWLLKKVSVSPTHFYVFVHLKDDPEYYIVPSSKVQRVHRNPDSRWASVYGEDIEDYKDSWEQSLRSA